MTALSSLISGPDLGSPRRGSWAPHAIVARRPFVHVLAVTSFLAAGVVSSAAQLAGRPITAAIVFLLGVMITGALEGIWGGLAAALAASVAYNFFLIEPTFRFSLASLDDWAPIVAFNYLAASVFVEGYDSNPFRTMRHCCRRHSFTNSRQSQIRALTRTVR